MPRLSKPNLVIACICEFETDHPIPDHFKRHLMYLPFNKEDGDDLKKVRQRRAIRALVYRLVRESNFTRKDAESIIRYNCTPVATLERRPKPERKDKGNGKTKTQKK